MTTPNDPAARALALFGTDEPVETPRRLRAGDLSVLFAGGALRDIRWGDLEIVRGLAFVIRDTRWGTYVPDLTALVVQEAADRFSVAYDGAVAGEEGAFRYAVRIEGSRDGRLTASAVGRSASGFRTNRTGFVVLHPLDGVVGHALLVGHPDGTTTRTAFPVPVRPDQPATDIARLTHAPAPGVQVELGFRGDGFEMEDHRNWTDASFKTYVRPLSRGYPYRIEPGQILTQAVDLAVSGPAPAAAAREGGHIDLRWGTPGEGTIPDLGLYADAAVLADPDRARDGVTRCRPRYVQARVDLRERAARDQLDRSLRLAAAAGCPLQLDAVIAGLDPADELQSLAAWAAGVGTPLDALFVIPARDLRSRSPGVVPPGEASAAAVLDAAKALFPGTRIGGGMPVGFPELNRNPPPAGIAWVTHATQAIVHAADDASVMETLQALPHIIGTMRGLAGNLHYRIGPATIAMHPSAAAAPPIETAGDRRVAIAARDPRQRGLFAAAFLLGYVAAARGVQAITPAAPTGDLGLFDADGTARPLATVFAGLAAQAGRPRLAATHAAPGRLAALAIATLEGPELWVANLTGEAIALQLEGPAIHQLLVIDAGQPTRLSFDRVSAAPDHLRLDSYAVGCARAWRESSG